MVVFQEYFYVSYCSTVFKCQGVTLANPYTIHKWDRMSVRMKYTAIGQATSKHLINVVASERSPLSNLPDTDIKKLKLREASAKSN